MPEEARRDRARELEVIRQQYWRNREALGKMMADSPTEHLAGEYQRLVHEIDSALKKLSELEGDTQPVIKTEPGTRRSLVTPPFESVPAKRTSEARSRITLIIAAGVIVLVLIGWLLWRAGSDERPATPIITETETVTTIPATPTPPPAALLMQPAAHDYGAIRRGTRASRQFEIANASDQPISIQVERSACRCLYYDYGEVVPPKGKETITVTVDGARIRPGQLQETIAVRSKRDPSIATSFEVTATIR